MVVEDDGKEREGEGLLHYLDKSISFSRSLEVKGGVSTLVLSTLERHQSEMTKYLLLRVEQRQ